MGRDFGVRFGGEELSYDFLTHSSDYFTKCLLDNPFLPEELKKKVYDLNPTFAQQHHSDVEDTRLLFSSLSAIHEKLVPFQRNGSDQDVLKLLDAEYLRKDLTWALGGGESGKGRPSVKDRLDSLARVNGGMEVILLCLLQDDHNVQWLSGGGPSHADLLDPTRRAVLDWLLQTAQSMKKSEDTEGQEVVGTSSEGEGGASGKQHQLSVSDQFWRRRHCKLLAQVSLRYFDFFKEHFQFLVARTKEMEKEREAVSVDMDVDSSERNGEGGHEQTRTRDGDERRSLDEQTPMRDGDGKRSFDEQALTRDNKAHTWTCGGHSLDDQVAWATSHWVALILAGGQVKDVCLSLLLKESQHPSQISREELIDAGCTLTLIPPADSVWKVVWRAVQC